MRCARAAAGLLAALAALSASCGRAGDQARLEPGAPVIRSAAIVPAEPLANSAVSVQVAADNPSGRPLHYRAEWFVDGRRAASGDGLEFQTHGLAPGAKLMARVTASDGTLDSRPFETPEAVIAENLAGIDSLAIVPSPVRTGTGTVTARPFFAPGAPANIAMSYRWNVNGKDAPATGPDLALSGVRAGDKITVEATPRVGGRSGNPFRLHAIVVNDAPVVSSITLASQDQSHFHYRIAASDPDNDPVSFHLVSGPAGVSVDGSSGTITVPIAVAGQTVRVRITDTAGNWIERDIGAGK